jgi:hypothetical protein
MRTQSLQASFIRFGDEVVVENRRQQGPELVARMGIVLLHRQRRFTGKAAEDQNGSIRIDYGWETS